MLEEIKLSAQLPVVSLTSLLQHVEVLLQGLLIWERGPVDSLKNLIPGIPSPVGSRDIQQLKCFDSPRGGKMGSLAQVEECSLAVERHSPVRKIFQMFNLICLPRS